MSFEDAFHKMMISEAAGDEGITRLAEACVPYLADESENADVTAQFAELVAPILGGYALHDRKDADEVLVTIIQNLIKKKINE